MDKLVLRRVEENRTTYLRRRNKQEDEFVGPYYEKTCTAIEGSIERKRELKRRKIKIFYDLKKTRNYGYLKDAVEDLQHHWRI